MKRLLTICAVALLLAMISTSVLAIRPADKGFDEFGYNYNARLFNGWDGYYDRNIEGGTGDARLVMKWSKDWIPMADQPIGAWVTNHFTWYSDDYAEDTWYGWYTRWLWTDKDSIPDTLYKVEEFAKIMKVSDDPVEWARYEAGGAFDCGWGSYESGVPKYVAFQDVVSVYETSWNVMGAWVLSFDYRGTLYIHDMTISTQADSLFSGTGAYPAGSTSPTTTWTVNGTVIGDDLTMTIAYDPPSTYETTATGSIAADGTVSGTWSSNTGQTGTWISMTGQGQAVHNLAVTYNLSTASPKGLGQPIF